MVTLAPVIERIRSRFAIGGFCIVADRGMINEEKVTYLEKKKIPYILAAWMRKVKEIKEELLSRAGRSREVHPESVSSKDPSPLKVKEVMVDDRRYIVCFNERQARKDAADLRAIIEALQEKLKSNPKSLVGNRGYRKYLSMVGIPFLSTSRRLKRRSGLTESGCSRRTPIFLPSRWLSSTRSSDRWSRSSGI